MDEKFNYTEDKNKIETQIKAIDNVNEFKYKSKKEYAEETKELDDKFSVIVDSWTEETIPLLDSYEITVKDVEKIDDTAKIVKNI